jgi:MFS family permease
MLAIMVQVGFVVHQVSFLYPVLGREGAGLAVFLTALMAATSRVVVGFFIDRLDRDRRWHGRDACHRLSAQRWCSGRRLARHRRTTIMLAGGAALVGLGHFLGRNEPRFLLNLLRDTIAAREA